MEGERKGEKYPKEDLSFFFAIGFRFQAERRKGREGGEHHSLFAAWWACEGGSEGGDGGGGGGDIDSSIPKGRRIEGCAKLERTKKTDLFLSLFAYLVKRIYILFLLNKGNRSRDFLRNFFLLPCLVFNAFCPERLSFEWGGGRKGDMKYNVIG